MADNFNTYKTIGDTVSMDALYRGIENMGKAIASARAAKAKAAAKSNDELQKMILTLDQQKGLTSLQAQKNKQDYATTLDKTLTAAKTDPNTTLNTFLTERQNYYMSSNMAVDQSKVEQEIRQKAGEGLISASVLDLYNQATKDGNMLPFLNPNNQLELNRQGIYVVPDPKSEAELTDGTKAPIWAFVSAPSLAKPKSIVDEFAKIKSDPSNYTSTISSVKTDTKVKGVYDNEVTESFTIKPEKVTELKEQLASDVGIQSLYRTDNELWNKKTLFQYEEINKDQTLQNLPQEEKLKLAAKRAIQKDIDEYNKNGLFNFDKKNLGTVTERSDTKIIINNPKPQYTVNDQAGIAPWTYNGAQILTGNLQTQWANQASYASGSRNKFNVGGMEGSKTTYLDSNLKPITANLASISNEWEYKEIYKINGKIYVEITPGITADKKVNIGSALIEVKRGSTIDNTLRKLYEVNGSKLASMEDWPGWNAVSNGNNAPVFK